MSETKDVAFLGTGLMGFPMAKNILSAGYNLTAWNRTGSKAAPLSEFGAQISDSVAEAVRGKKFIISMLSDGNATGSLFANSKNMEALKPGAIWIDMASAKPEQAREQMEMLQALDCDHIDAPVSGGTKGAEAGTLAIMAGGRPSDFGAVEDLLSTMGRPVHVGPAGSGQLAKLANQAIVAITIGAVAEAMLLLRAGNADTAAVRDALRGGFADSTILQQHGARMTGNDFQPGGPSKLHLKDLENILSEAQSLNLKLPSTESIYERFRILVDDMNGADLDHSALFLELLRRNE